MVPTNETVPALSHTSDWDNIITKLKRQSIEYVHAVYDKVKFL